MADELKLLEAHEFPSPLREIPDSPKRLYIRGSLPPEDHAWLAVVGSRACTPYGKQATRYLIEGLRGYPVVIVSGLAYGIDAEAHRTALDAGLPTVAVPGSGLDWNVLYPKANVSLAKDILAAGGAILSEEAPDAQARDFMFPKRNRIMAGLCRATLMVEARGKSGSLITAKLTTEYNRELLVVPGSIFSEESAGTHQFLRLGATPVTTAGEILQSLGIVPRENASLTSLRDDLTEEEITVCDILRAPMTREELLASLEMSASEANVLLSMMEIKGVIVEEVGFMRLR